MSIIGLDLGTSGVRAVAFDGGGGVRAHASARLALSRDGRGRVELDGDAILTAAERVVAHAASGAAAAGDPVRAIGLSILGEAVVPVDAEARLLAPVAVSMDTRGTPHALALGDAIGADRFSQITGQPLHGMFSLFKIMAGDERWRDAAGYRCVGDLVAERWTGRPGIDLSQAARTGALDVGTGDWSPDIFEFASEFAPWLREDRMPEPVAAGEVIARLAEPAASRLGLPAGTPVVAGAHDQAAAFLGAGGDPGIRSVIAFGSSDCMTIGTCERPHNLAGTGFATYRVRDGLWVTLAGTAAGGWALEWFAGLLDRPVVEVFDALSEVPPGLLFLPYLAGSGTLDNDPGARGVIHGLTLDTTVPDVARAVVEGAGYEFHKIVAALVSRGIAVGDLRVTGSGADNRAALAARVDASGLSLTPAPPDASARGAAMFALAAIGGDPAELSPRFDEHLTVSPSTDPDGWYARQRRAYVELYESTQGIASHLASSPASHQKENHT
ncbi:FGGY-family carbohydrate kinase [Microbacterium sp.]|uniref:FGGY-family carbohydrate kinase n=1 Tax=Microbacterium sp. TaxID=51671 RepID=UPI0028122FB8|nr:FGGY-family carbohydrate kinase [Microbacterium sp.]